VHPWSFPRRLIFRFVCVYFLLYAFPGTGRISAFIAIPRASNVFVTPWHIICFWVGSHWFHLGGLAIAYIRTGSGDTTLLYIQNFPMALLAVIAAVVWSLIDRMGAEPANRARRSIRSKPFLNAG
jgi:hypothetical protein